jgi:putative RNA 2'-phosphotransferase
MNKRLTRISKYMTFVLFHEPKSIGLQLDPEGWTDVGEFIAKANASGKSVTSEQVMAVAAATEPPRFELSSDQTRIRAIKVAKQESSKEASRKALKEAKKRGLKEDEPKAEAGRPVFTKSRLAGRTSTD